MSEKTASAAALSRPMRLLCIGLLVLLGFSLGCSEFVVIGIEVNIADAFSVTLAQAGELISMFAITYAACTPVLAIVTGRFRRFQLLVAYAAIFCAANLVQALAPTFAVLLLSRVLIGAVSGAFLAVGVTFIPELMGPERMSMGISVVYAAFSVAMVVATSAGKMVAELFTWRSWPCCRARGPRTSRRRCASRRGSSPSRRCSRASSSSSLAWDACTCSTAT
ncbi:MFS transporter [Parolsenella catena]|uniref:MFS transporter n=1 Tax=Parolsenella catena TaxID=2003188 RepID=UPI002FDA9513